MHNAGNDAMLCLFALQKLLDPAGTRAPSVKKGRVGRPGAGQQQQQQQQLGNTAGVYVNGMGMNGMVAMNGMVPMNGMNGMAINGMGMGMNKGMVPMPMLDEPHDDWELTHACSHISGWKPWPTPQAFGLRIVRPCRQVWADGVGRWEGDDEGVYHGAVLDCWCGGEWEGSWRGEGDGERGQLGKGCGCWTGKEVMHWVALKSSNFKFLLPLL